MLSASNGQGDKYESLPGTPELLIDYTKPATPSVTFLDGIPTFTSKSLDVASYKLFEKQIEEGSSEESFIPEVSFDALVAMKDSLTYNMCGDTMPKLTYDFKVIALDGTGNFGTANASNILSFKYVNNLKNAHLLTTTFAEGQNDTKLGDLYDDNCVKTPAIEDSGISIRSLVPDTTIKLSFQPKLNTKFSSDKPTTAYYKIPGTSDSLLKITLLPIYSGEKVFIEFDGKLYSTVLTTAEGDSTHPIELIALTDMANQTF
jgi:hypothetical protein